MCKEKSEANEIFIIGGESIYSKFLEHSDKLYLTEIDEEEKSADVFFPEFNKSNYTSELIRENEDNESYNINLFGEHIDYIDKFKEDFAYMADELEKASEVSNNDESYRIFLVGESAKVTVKYIIES